MRALYARSVHRSPTCDPHLLQRVTVTTDTERVSLTACYPSVIPPNDRSRCTKRDAGARSLARICVWLPYTRSVTILARQDPRVLEAHARKPQDPATCRENGPSD